MFRFVTDPIKRGWDRVRRQMAIWVWDRSSDEASTEEDGRFNREVVFIRWDAKLGDTIVLSWVWRALQQQRPDLKITVITGESFQDLFANGYGIKSTYVAGKRHGWSQLRGIASQIGRPQYVVHLSLKWRARDIRFVRMLNAQHVVGLDDALKLVDVKLGAQTQARHFSEKLVPWLERLGIDTDDRRYWVPRQPGAARGVDHWWPRKGRVIALCPYGASRKKCLNDSWIIRTVQFCVTNGFQVVILTLPERRAHIEHLIAANPWGKFVFTNPGDSSQYVLFEQLARSDAVLSVDTAVVHLAVALQKPLLAVYNSVDQEFINWHPNDANALVVRTVHANNATVNEINESALSCAMQDLLERCR